ncbi:translation machinery-associated protein 22 [Prunus yedoensis var. nudiflora]|uniref:Translation machinery-associated protein 22 n=1 Tax=Prunus yedoensis var. nudiflora TaxID=2094558 RepID=A0A314YQQ7_PRUYE|nr:translation machinery-associated protein 22 [Prunus yedoensis var. nudiflora]
MQALVDPKRPRPLPESQADAKEADKVANQLQSTGISSGGDGAASSSGVGGGTSAPKQEEVYVSPTQEEVKRLPGEKIKEKERQ